MRPTDYLTRHNYPIVIGLAFLLLPYLWRVLVWPYSLSSRIHNRDRFEVNTTPTTTSTSTARASSTAGFRFWRGKATISGSTSNSVTKTSTRGRFDIWKRPKTTTTLSSSLSSKSASSSSSVKSVTSTSSAKRIDIWGGIKEVIGPKWEEYTGFSEPTTPATTTRSTSKSITTPSTKSTKRTDNKPTSNKSAKTSSTKNKSENVKTVTESVTRTIKKTVEKPIIENSDTESSFIIEEIDSMGWHQTTFTLASRSRGCYLITDEVVKNVPEIKKYKVGLLHLFIQHTSAGLTLNENWDSDVRKDMIDAFDKLAPANADYRHNAEGSDDMPAHIKSVLTGTSVSVPISAGKLALGTWQGIYLCEFRTSSHRRTLVATIQGE